MVGTSTQRTLQMVNLNRDKGSVFVRYVKSLAIARGDHSAAIGFAQSQGWNNAREVVESIKATIAPQSMSDAGIIPTPAAMDFADFIRPLTIIGRLTGLRRAPARTRVIAATNGSTAYWSGESQPRPISKMTLAGSILEPLSVIAMLVATQELIQFSSDLAESILSRDLAAAAVYAMDSAFIDPANAGIAGVKPASITNGVTTFHSSGNTLDNISADLDLLVEALSGSGSNLLYPAWILRPRTWVYLKRLRGSSGALAWPGLTTVRDGGELLGFPVIVSSASPSDVGSPQEGGEITLVDASMVQVVDSGGALAVSTQASIAMSDVPGSPATQVSMWQSNAVSIKTTRYTNWEQVRPGMAQVLDVVTY
jgi:HK97 family phage major capsid protein